MSDLKTTSATPIIELTGTTCFWGRSEMGKSTLAQKALGAAIKAAKGPKRQVVVVDPQSRDGTDATGVLAALEAGAETIICNSSQRDHQIGAIVYALNHSTLESPVYVVADEAPSYMDKPRDILSRAVLQGRHAGFGIMIIGQRPASVYAEYRTQAKLTVWMGLVDHTDVEAARKSMGKSADDLTRLKQGEYIKWPQ